MRVDEGAPEVGIWFIFRSKLYMDAEPAKDLEEHNGIVDYDAMHADFWDDLKEMYPDVKFPEEYLDVPRGRILLDKNRGKYEVYGPPQVVNGPEKWKDYIISMFSLPKNNTEFLVDSHYLYGKDATEMIEEVFREDQKKAYQQLLEARGDSVMPKIKEAIPGFYVNKVSTAGIFGSVKLSGDRPLLMYKIHIKGKMTESRVFFNKPLEGSDKVTQPLWNDLTFETYGDDLVEKMKAQYEDCKKAVDEYYTLLEEATNKGYKETFTGFEKDGKKFYLLNFNGVWQCTVEGQKVKGLDQVRRALFDESEGFYESSTYGVVHAFKSAGKMFYESYIGAVPKTFCGQSVSEAVYNDSLSALYTACVGTLLCEEDFKTLPVTTQKLCKKINPNVNEWISPTGSRTLNGKVTFPDVKMTQSQVQDLINKLSKLSNLQLSAAPQIMKVLNAFRLP